MNSLKHIAIIMDGNGRWAQSRRRPRVWGHIRGAKSVSHIVEKADDLGISSLTLYAFSTENWSRPKTEVLVLFKILKKFIVLERERILRNNIVFDVIGDYSHLPTGTVKLIEDLKFESSQNNGLKLVFAFGYGGRDEILKSVNAFIENRPFEKMTEKDIASNLMTGPVEDIDLLIRTGGDQRVSNFLLWQLAYSELYFTPTPWPEFTAQEFEEILCHVSTRDRRFGSIDEDLDLSGSKELAHKNKLIDLTQAVTP